MATTGLIDYSGWRDVWIHNGLNCVPIDTVATIGSFLPPADGCSLWSADRGLYCLSRELASFTALCEEIVMLDSAQIRDYLTIHNQRLGAVLPLGKFLQRCFRLTHLDLSGKRPLALEDADLALIPSTLQVLKAPCSKLIYPNFAHLSQLRVLDLSCSDALEKLSLEQMPQLEELLLDGCSRLRIQIPDLQRMTQLRILNLSTIPGFPLLDLRPLQKLEHCVIRESPDLKELNVFGLMHLRSLDLFRSQTIQRLIIADSIRLVGLSLAFCIALESPQRLEWVNQQTDLEWVDLSGWIHLEHFSARAFPKLCTLILRYCPALHTIDIENACLEKAYLEGCEQIEYLDFMGAPRITHLDLDCCTRLMGMHLNGLSALDTLSLVHCHSFQDPHWQELTGLKNLSLNHCYGLRNFDARAFPQLRRLYMQECSGLLSCDIRGLTRLKGIVLLHATQLKTLFAQSNDRLEVLDISFCSALPEIGLKNFPQLELLQADGCDELREVSFEGLAYLEHVFLRRNTHLGYVFGAHAPQLKSLVVSDAPHLISVDLSYGAELTSAWFMDCNLLEDIRLTGCRKLADLKLEQLPQLRYLDLVRCPKKLMSSLDEAILEQAYVSHSGAERKEGSKRRKTE